MKSLFARVIGLDLLGCSNICSVVVIGKMTVLSYHHMCMLVELSKNPINFMEEKVLACQKDGLDALRKIT
ncbi:hypothetical protein Lal_00001925 [Lupinus albus]|nr:hypothetical protein Lal_00001925 [Lupinus albus]